MIMCVMALIVGATAPQLNVRHHQKFVIFIHDV